MASRLITIADALMTALNGETFSVALTAARRHSPSFDLKDLDDLAVSVVPRRRRLDLQSRRDLERQYRIDVAFHKRLAAVGDQAAEAALIALCEEVESFVIGAEVSGAVCISTDGIAGDDEAYAQDVLRDQNVFFWGFSATFWEVTPK